VLGQTVESFLHSGDGDRDGAFRGTWRTTGQEDLAGAFVIQCKFTSKRDYVIRTADLSDELEKAQKLVAKGHCDSYVLMTNAGLTGTRAAAAAPRPAAGYRRTEFWGWRPRRKLLVALWKYVTAGVVIEGAVMKTA
jgi:hypothetical protein